MSLVDLRREAAAMAEAGHHIAMIADSIGVDEHRARVLIQEGQIIAKVERQRQRARIDCALMVWYAAALLRELD